MRAPQACLALLLTAAVLLQGTAAENKCDPSSAHCQGPVKESGRKAGLKQYDEEPYADNVHEYDGYGLQFQQEGGLEGAKVWGQLLFNTQTPQGGPNFFDEEEGYVPEGYGNCHPGGPWSIINDNYKAEFAYEGSSNLFTLDLDSTGMLVLTDVVKVTGNNNPMVIVLKSKAFEGYEATLLHNNFKDSPATLVATITGDTIVIVVPDITELQNGDRQVAVWKLSVCSESDASVCCYNGQYRKKHYMCRSSDGPCDVPEFCSGYDGTCPEDEYKEMGIICKYPNTFCDAPDVCTGMSADCPELLKEDGTPCPWAKDCDDCIINSTLQYSRTGPKPYYHGYKGGEYSVPISTWPVCIGKCAAGKCEINPVAATCCREDEEAYPLEDEFDEYRRDDVREYEDRDDDYYYRVGVTARAQARGQSDDSDDEYKPKPKQTSTVKKSASGKKYRKRKSSTKQTTDKYGKDSDKYGTKYGKDSDKHHDESKYGKDSDKHYDESKHRKHPAKEPKEPEDDYFSGKHTKQETKPEPKKEEPSKDDKPSKVETITKGEKPYEYKYKPGRKDTPKSEDLSKPKDAPKSEEPSKPKDTPKFEEPAKPKEDKKPRKDDDDVEYFTGKYDGEFFGGKHDGPSTGDKRGPTPEYFGGKHSGKYEPREYEPREYEHPEQYHKGGPSYKDPAHKDPRYKAEYDFDYQQYYSRQGPEDKAGSGYTGPGYQQYKPAPGYKGPGPYEKPYEKPEYYKDGSEQYEQYEKPSYKQEQYEQYEKPSHEQEQYHGEDAYYGDDDDSEMPLSCWA